MAAAKLNVTQSTISARIKSLEDRLGQQLIFRKRNGVVLTGAGHQFHSNAINVVRAWERGMQVVGLPEDMDALINIGIEENHCSVLMADLLQRFELNLPDVATRVLAEPSIQLMHKLREGLLDVAVLYDPQNCAEVTIEHLSREDLVMYATEQRKVTAGTVPGYVFVDWGDTFRALHSAEFPGVFSHRLTMRQSTVALDHILKHGGSGYFLCRAASPYVEKGLLIPVENAPKFQRALFIASRNNAVAPQLLQSVMDIVRSSAF